MNDKFKLTEEPVDRLMQAFVSLLDMKHIQAISNIIELEENDINPKMLAQHIVVDVGHSIGENIQNVELSCVNNIKANKLKDAFIQIQKLNFDLKYILLTQMSQENILDYIATNSNGTYKKIKYTSDSPNIQYLDEVYELEVDKQKVMNPKVALAFYDLFQHYWKQAFMLKEGMKRYYDDVFKTKGGPGRKKNNYSLYDVLMDGKYKEWLNLMQKNIRLNNVKFDFNTGEYLWKADTKELGNLYHSNRDKLFKTDKSNPDVGSALLKYFNLPETKSSMQVFQNHYKRLL